MALLALAAAAFALAATPPPTRGSRHSAATSQLLPPVAIKPAASRRPPGRPRQVIRSARVQERSSPASRGRSARQVGDPERPPSPESSAAAMLIVARQFALAYMPYEIGRLPHWARVAITRTCTAAFARYLLGHPARETRLLAAHPNDVETYRVASVNLAAGADRAAVSYVSAQDHADTGAFMLTLAKRRGRWVVAGLDP
jgi:hypothetical protein